MVPGKPRKKSQGKSGNFTQNTGKVRKLYWKIKKKYWKSPGNLLASNSENPANIIP